MTEETTRVGDQPEPLSAEDERILDDIMATFTEEDMDEWARQIEEDQQPKQQQKEPR